MVIVLAIIVGVVAVVWMTTMYLRGRHKADFVAGYNSARIEDHQQAEVNREKFQKKSENIDRLCSTHRQRLRNWLRKANGGDRKLPLPK